MISIRVTPEGVRLSLSAAERRTLTNLVGQLERVVRAGPDDPAVARLFPDARLDDPIAAIEFRELTLGGLQDRKQANAQTVAASLEQEAPLLDEPTATAWLKVLTDLRLVVAERLGIEDDGDEGMPDETLQGLYEWLGHLQESLLHALSGRL